MPARGTFVLSKMSRKLDTMKEVLAHTRRPPIGVTQGGSSNKYAGCKSAASRGVVRRRKTK